MSPMTTHIYSSGDRLPQLVEGSFFHSRQLFEVCRHTPRQRPYMVTVETPDGHVVAQLLAVVRRRASWFPPYLYRHCRVLGEGVYADAAASAEQFGMMLSHLKRRLGRRVLYIEVSNLSQKMFGYRQFRHNSFFPVRWMSIDNLLGADTGTERLGKRTRRHIASAHSHGVTSGEASTPAERQQMLNLLRSHNRLKPKRYIPADEFFLHLVQSGHGRLFVTRWQGHVIGCSVVVYSQRQAHLWYIAFRRKTYARLHPATLTLWHALDEARRQGMQHMLFMDVGLPFRHNAYRDFILRFGGQPVGTYRWFHCSVGWVNRLLSWLYRD